MSTLRHSISRWCFSKIPLPELCPLVKGLGIESIELTNPNEWPVLKEHGLMCAMSNPVDTIPDSLNRRENHARLIPLMKERLEQCAKAGVPAMVCFSGNRRGQSDAEGLEICTEGYKQLVGTAEKLGVTLCVELLNSKVNHPDYQCDHTAWGVELCKRVGSERLKLLYDIYHMQVMEGDVIRTIQQNHTYIAHYHTAGNPGRNEIDATQELNYPAIMLAIKETGYRGFIGQEFVPKRDPMESLKQAIALCTV